MEIVLLNNIPAVYYHFLNGNGFITKTCYIGIHLLQCKRFVAAITHPALILLLAWLNNIGHQQTALHTTELSRFVIFPIL